MVGESFQLPEGMKRRAPGTGKLRLRRAAENVAGSTKRAG
jgi:hypothetical protein